MSATPNQLSAEQHRRDEQERRRRERDRDVRAFVLQEFREAQWRHKARAPSCAMTMLRRCR